MSKFCSVSKLATYTFIALFGTATLIPQATLARNNNGDGAIIPTLWGIDEDDGQLFAMGDYTDSSTMIDYGYLKWNNNGVIEPIDTDMEAMTLDTNGDMYIALDRNLIGNNDAATLLKFNIKDASTTEDNIVEVLGEIGITFDSRGDNITGLSIDPFSGELFAGLKNYNSNNQRIVDQLFVISKADGSLVRTVGSIEGLGQESKRLEDIEHAPDGSLYVTQNMDDHTYKVNSSNGAIIEVTDNDQKDGLGSEVKFEALGWDFANNRLIGFDDDDESLANLTLENGNNYEYYKTNSIGLTDVEGVDFVPTPDGNPIDDVNNAPELQDYSLRTFVNQPVTVDVIADAVDAEGDALSIVGIDNVTGGTVTHVNGSITYVHSATGTYTFNYTVSDGTDTSVGNISVEVLGYPD